MHTRLIGTHKVYWEDARSQTLPEEAKPRKLLKNLATIWKDKAQVKKEELNAEALLDVSRPDFRADLLPFKDHPNFLEASASLKQKILSCGWLAYNQKTVGIESEIVMPVCTHIIYGEVPGVKDEVSKQIASQTLVDEAYHVLLVNNACRVTREERELRALRLPTFNLIRKMQEAQATYSERWQQIIIHVATAIVSEVFISDYLKLLSSDTSIQPFNRLTVDVHRRDELAHSGAFKNMAKCIYADLSQTEREFFIDVLSKPVRWFASLELDVWTAMLEQIGFPATTPAINDCKSLNADSLARLNYSGIIALAKELGILDSQRGMDNFYREGLVG